MKDFFPESLGQKHGCTLYTGVHYTWQNTVVTAIPLLVINPTSTPAPIGKGIQECSL